MSLKSSFKFKIIIYGSIDENYKDMIMCLVDNDFINYLGWANQDQIAKIIVNSTYCVFPGRHSVLWEEAVGLGVPLIVKRIDGYEHIDIGGNVFFLDESSENYYINVMKELLNKDVIYSYKCKASGEKRKDFLYSVIAKKSIEMEI